MTAQIYVLDTETTGLGGALEGDVIVEIGISRVDLDREKVYPEYGKIIRQELTTATVSSGNGVKNVSGDTSNPSSGG